MKGYRYPELPEEKLLAKIKYLREFVDTISKADPVSNKLMSINALRHWDHLLMTGRIMYNMIILQGYPKWKGQALYDLQRAVLIRANSEFNAGTLSKVLI